MKRDRVVNARADARCLQTLLQPVPILYPHNIDVIDRSRLRALISLLTAFKRSAGERAALQEYIEAEYECERNSPLTPSADPIAVTGLRSAFRIDGSVSEWVSSSNLSMVRSATMIALQTGPFVPGSASLTCSRKAGRAHVEARWNVDTLETALSWMVWQDESTQHPILCCQECRKIFRADYAHERKYCSYECGHRVAARKWQKAQRKRQGVNHGARKAR